MGRKKAQEFEDAKPELKFDPEQAEHMEQAVAMIAAAAPQPVKLPHFYENRPIQWFRLIEAQFRAKKVVRDDDKYFHALSVLKEHQIDNIDETFKRMDAPDFDGDRYETLKVALINHYKRPPVNTILEFLNSDHSGLHPLELFREMNRLDDNLESFRMAIFLQKSSSATQAVIKTRLDSLKSMSEMAKFAAETSTSSSTPISSVSAVSGKASKPFKKKGSRKFCKYHLQFGVKAKNCTLPCDWVTKPGVKAITVEEPSSENDS